MKYNKRSKKSPSQKGGRAPCLDSVPSSCYKVIVDMHGTMPYADRYNVSEINFPFASLKYYVPNAMVSGISVPYFGQTYLGDLCNDRPELIIEEIPKDDTPGRLATSILTLAIVKSELDTIEEEKSVKEGTMIDMPGKNGPMHMGIYLCKPAIEERSLAASAEKAEIDEILSATPRKIFNPPTTLARREERIRTRKAKYASPVESTIKLFSARELFMIPQVCNSTTGKLREVRPDDDLIHRILINKLKDVDTTDDGTAGLPFYLHDYGEVVALRIGHLIRIIKPQLEKRGIDIANCELCIISCRSWQPADASEFIPDTPEAIAEDKLTGASPKRFANFDDFNREQNRMLDLVFAKSADLIYEGNGFSQYSTSMMDKREQNAEWLRRKKLGLPPQEGVPDRLQNVYTDNHGRIETPFDFKYRLQDDEYGKYSPVWDAAWANLKQRWYRNGEPYNPGTLTNIAKSRELVLRKGTSSDKISSVALQTMRTGLITAQASEVLQHNPYIAVTSSQMYAYLTPPEPPSMKDVLEAVTDEELKDYVIDYEIVDEPDNSTAKLLVDIQTKQMDSVNDRQCPSHDKNPQPCTTPENSYKKQLLVFHPDKNLKCPEAATEKFKYFNAICKEPDNTAGGSKTRKRRKTRRRIKMRRRKTRRR